MTKAIVLGIGLGLIAGGIQILVHSYKDWKETHPDEVRAALRKLRDTPDPRQGPDE